jgi:hypothetical protein
LGPIISRFFACSNEEKSMRALVLSQCLVHVYGFKVTKMVSVAAT